MRYPFFKRGDVVRVINSTYSPSSQTRLMAKERAVVTVEQRRRRKDFGELGPHYITHDYRGAQWYFHATDLEKVTIKEN